MRGKIVIENHLSAKRHQKKPQRLLSRRSQVDSNAPRSLSRQDTWNVWRDMAVNFESPRGHFWSLYRHGQKMLQITFRSSVAMGKLDVIYLYFQWKIESQLYCYSVRYTKDRHERMVLSITYLISLRCLCFHV